MKNRKLLFFWPVLIIGIALIVMPFAMSMPSKAGAGQDMLDNFRPIMQPDNVVSRRRQYLIYKSTAQCHGCRAAPADRYSDELKMMAGMSFLSILPSALVSMNGVTAAMLLT